MSRAFIKEKDGDSGDDGLPERQAKAGPNYVTAEGLADLKRRLADALAEQARHQSSGDDPKTKAARSRLARDIRYLERRIGDAVVAKPAATGGATLGSTVTIDTGAAHMIFTVVGEDEADPAAGRISHTSPLGAALMGASAGATVVWPRPVGDIAVTVLKVEP